MLSHRMDLEFPKATLDRSIQELVNKRLRSTLLIGHKGLSKSLFLIHSLPVDLKRECCCCLPTSMQFKIASPLELNCRQSEDPGCVILASKKEKKRRPVGAYAKEDDHHLIGAEDLKRIYEPRQSLPKNWLNSCCVI